jgi:aryl-alcohol dehydrogenase-like predicted oxidoreductase
MLDTAAAYGDIEARLARLSEGHSFGVVTKLPSKPPGLTASDARDWVNAALRKAYQRLGTSLCALMFHRADDLLDESGDYLWNRCAEWAERHRCKLGVSCYEPDTLARVRDRFPVAIAQLPANALDQRWAATDGAAGDGVEVHLRSAFLQGLLLMPEAEAAARVPRAAPALAHWHAWLRECSLAPLQAALGIVKGLPGCSHCVIGVDNEAQLEAIAAAWQEAAPLQAAALATRDLDVIDPRRWPPQP